MLHFVRTATLLLACIGAMAAWAVSSGQQFAYAQSRVEQAEDNSEGKPAGSKARRKPGKGQAAKDDAAAAPVDAEATLDKAHRALADGKAAVAFGLADQVVRHAKKDPRNTARALAVRGEAHLHQGRPAEALADLESALWVKGGLAGAEREAATTARANALQQSGLAANSPSPNDSGRSASRRSADSSRAVAGASPDPAPAPSSGGIGGFFSSLFGGGGKPTSEASQAPVATAAARPTQPALSSSEPQRADDPTWKSRAVPSVKPSRATTAVAVPAAPASAPVGAYRIQLAAVRSRSEAEAMANAVRKDETAVLEARSFEIVEETYGNMGRFYRVRIGTFESPTVATAICASLRQKRIDCMMLGQ